MKDTQSIMGMPITVEIVDDNATVQTLQQVFDYFTQVDRVFSTYKPDSEISRINAGEILPEAFSRDMRTIFQLSETTKQQTQGYFDMGPVGLCDPSGVVKGWAINQAAQRLRAAGWKKFYVEAGGDIQADGVNAAGTPWRVGIRNPFAKQQIVKAITLSNKGVATSGSYERGAHIYNPHDRSQPITNIVSLTVVGPNVCEADRFATGAFAMGRAGIAFIEHLPGFEGYMIDEHGVATMTSGFDAFVRP